MKLANEHNTRSIAFPGISTGVYHFPKVRAAEIAVAAIRETMGTANMVQKVIFVCFDKENYDIYHNLLKAT